MAMFIFIKQRRLCSKARGFTLLEVVVVLSVVVILVSIAIPRIMGFQDEARINQAKRELRAIKSALESYASSHRGQYPSQTDTITAVLKEAVPQMLDQVLYDPFGEASTSEYLYSVTADGKDYVVSSLGPDRVNGTARIISFGSVPSSGDDLVTTSGTIAELNLNTDTNNCGAIGTVCAEGQICSAGSCTVSECSVDGDCASGYFCNAGICADINECDTDNGGCDVNATCANTAGSLTCTCYEGYTGDGTSGNCLATYTVTYDANGATSGSIPTAQTKTDDVALTLASNSGTLARTGYVFSGWNTAVNGTGTNYAVNASYTGNAAVTLHAKWVDACSGSPAIGTVCSDGTVYVSASLRTTSADAPGTMDVATATAYCDALTAGTYTDWVLPSDNEANFLYLNKVALGGFGDYGYWLSGFQDSWGVYQSFSDGHQGPAWYLNLWHVRCVRHP